MAQTPPPSPQDPDSRFMLTQGRIFIEETFDTPAIKGDVVVTASDFTLRNLNVDDPSQQWIIDIAD